MSFQKVQESINKACQRVGRSPNEVTLVAVTKNHNAEEISQKVLSFNHAILGENRVQEWLSKKEILSNDNLEIQWHMIGNLQTNKVKYCRDFHSIHSLNSIRLANEMQKQGLKHKHIFRVFVEVNMSGEYTKQGIEASRVKELVEYAKNLSYLEVCGLMAMAPYTSNPEEVRPFFKKLRLLSNKLNLQELSMGMSNDFEIAIEEGATFVRVGSALFEN